MKSLRHKTEEKNAAIFFNGNYSYAGKYLFQVMVRRDGSSRFGSNKRWATFWSVGGGWNMHEEDFIKNIEWINQLKPRISYGISGNLPGGAYEWVTKFDITQQYGDEIAFIPTIQEIRTCHGNKQVHWTMDWISACSTE